MISTWGRRLTRPLSAVVALVLFAGMLVFGSALPASAAPGQVTGASLNWGFKSSWRGYVGGVPGSSTTPSGGATASPTPYSWGDSTGGSFDESTSTGEVTFGGAITWKVPAHGIDITLSNPDLTLTSASVGTLAFDYSDSTGKTGTAVFADLDLSAGTMSVADGVATFSGVAASAAQATVDTFSGFYPLGAALDSVSFSLPYEEAPTAPVAVATTTSLSAAPAAATEGDTLSLAATVSAAAGGEASGTDPVGTDPVGTVPAGTVQFFDGADALGSPVTVDAAGTAAAALTATAGTHSYTAEFIPADPAAFEPSTSAASVVAVAAKPAQPIVTTTTLDATPASTSSAPALLGASTTITATVTPASGSAVNGGSVEFFDIAAGSSASTSLGTAPVFGGTAAVTAALPAGGHTFRALYTPSSAFAGSEATSTANYAVVDGSEPTVCVPAAASASSTGASASWDYNEYSAQWAKSATGNISVDGSTFALTGGSVVADERCAVVSFTGSLRVTAYGLYAVDLANPTLTVNASGAGSWSADVSSGDVSAGLPAPVRVTVDTFSGATGVPAQGASGTVTAPLAYTGNTAAGTWSVANGVAYSDSWSNPFVLQVLPSIRSFYYTSGTSPAQATKPPAPLSATFSWPVTSTLALAATPAAPALLGDAAPTLTATVTPATATGSVQFFRTDAASGSEVSLGTAPLAADGSATLTSAQLAAGGHTFRAAFTATSGGTDATASTSNYGVVDTAEPAVYVPGPGAATLDGVTANWDYSAYSSGWAKTAGGNVSVSGQTFALTGGHATYDAGGATVQFTGSLRVTAYGQFWVELTDPLLSIAADGSGSWSALVTNSDLASGSNGVVAGADGGTPGVTSSLVGSTPTRVTVDTFHGATVPDFATTGETSIALDYAATTAPGTWAYSAGVAYGDAWSNAFIMQVPSSIRAFYYQSGTSAANATKPPAPLTVGWTAAVVTPPVDPPASSGELTWGFKSSWRSYVTMFGGTITPTNGAGITADGLYRFGQADGSDYDQATNVGTVKYRGTIEFSNPSHGFDMALADPWVVFGADGSVVLSAETSTTSTSGAGALTRVVVADLTVPAATKGADELLLWSDVPGVFADTLAPDGWGDQYVGAAIDPVTFSYGAAAVVPPVDPGQPGQPGQPVEPPVTTPPATTPDAPVVPAVDEPAQKVCVAQQVSGGTLNWGVKASFVSYITGPIAKGAISTSGISSSNGFTWAGGSGTFNTDDSRGLVSFDGSVHFTGHAGALDMTIANPRVQITSTGSAVLVADVSSKSLDGTSTSGAVTLANVDLASASSASVTSSQARWVNAPTTLTSSGAASFGGFYQAGIALDPLTLTLPLGATVACDGYSAAAGSAGSLAETGANLTPLWGGLAFLLAGMGILSLRRHRRNAVAKG